MKQIDNFNVIKYLDHGQKEYVKPAGNKLVSFIALEIAEKGELFDYVANTGHFSEPVARYFFKQLLAGLKACHEAGVSHRDMKAENIFLDKNYDMKIGDFGLAAGREKADENGLFKTSLGTTGYMAPEIILK